MYIHVYSFSPTYCCNLQLLKKLRGSAAPSLQTGSCGMTVRKAAAVSRKLIPSDNVNHSCLGARPSGRGRCPGVTSLGMFF